MGWDPVQPDLVVPSLSLAGAWDWLCCKVPSSPNHPVIPAGKWEQRTSTENLKHGKTGTLNMAKHQKQPKGAVGRDCTALQQGGGAGAAPAGSCLPLKHCPSSLGWDQD